MMINRRTLCGLFLCTVGLVLTRCSSFFQLAENSALLAKMVGILVCFFGLTVFASGLRTRIEETIKICPQCFKKNSAKETICKKCGKVF